MSQKGFTLVEIIVVVGIIAILPTIIIANYPQIKLQFALSRAASEFAQNARHAQDMSLASMQYKDAEGINRSAAGYGVNVDLTSLGNKSYLLYADALPSNKQYDNLVDYIVETIDLSSAEPGVVIKEIHNVFGDKVSINFNPPDPTTTLTPLNGGQSSVEVVFALESDLSKTKTVSINSSGLIEVK